MMGAPIVYAGKFLHDHDLWELEKHMHDFLEAEKKRELASKHPKFDKKNNKKAMDFPPPNPEYLKLKNAILKEIESRKNVQTIQANTNS